MATGEGFDCPAAGSAPLQAPENGEPTIEPGARHYRTPPEVLRGRCGAVSSTLEPLVSPDSQRHEHREGAYDPQPAFEFGLTRVLDGIAALIGHRG